MQEEQPGLIQWAILLVLAIIWGSSFILIKYALFQDGEAVLSGYEVGALRMFIASLSLLPITLRHARWFKSHWSPLLVVGVFGNGLPAFLFAIAQTRIDSSLSGMLNSVTPLFTLMVGVAIFSVRTNKNTMFGVLLGLVAAVLLIGTSGTESGNNDPMYAGLALMGSFCYAVSVNTIKSRLQEIPTLAIAGLALSFAGLPCLIYLLSMGFPVKVVQDPNVPTALAYVSILAVIGTAFALVLFNRLVETTSAVFSSSVTYLLPVVAIAWGVLDGERISVVQYLCIGFILLSVMLVGMRPRYK